VSKIGRLTVLLFVLLAGCFSSELAEMRIVSTWPDMERGDWLQQTTQTFYPNTIVDNLLACSDAHVKTVFAMLARVKRERKKRPEFTGGLESRRPPPFECGLREGVDYFVERAEE